MRLWLCIFPLQPWASPLFTCGPIRQKLQGMEQELRSKSLNCQAELYNFFQLSFPPSEHFFVQFPESTPPTLSPSLPAPTPAPSSSLWAQLCSNCQKLSVQFTEAATHYTWDQCFRDFDSSLSYASLSTFLQSAKSTKRVKVPPTSAVTASPTVSPTSARPPPDCSELQDLHNSLTNMVHEDERLLADLTKTMRQTLESMRETLAVEKKTINMSTFAACSGYQPLIAFETDVVNRGLDLVVALETEMKYQACPVRTSEMLSQWWLLHQRLLLVCAGALLVLSGCAVKRAFANSFPSSCWRRDRSAGASYGSIGFTKRNAAKNQRKVTWATVLSSARSPTSSRHSSSSPRRGSPSLSPWTSPEPEHGHEPRRDPPSLAEHTWSMSLPSGSPQASPVFGFLIQHPEHNHNNNHNNNNNSNNNNLPGPPLACEKANSLPLPQCPSSPFALVPSGGKQILTLSPLGASPMSAPVTITMTVSSSPRGNTS